MSQPIPIPKHIASLEELIKERSKQKLRLNKLIKLLRQCRRYGRMMRYMIENKEQRSELIQKETWQKWKNFKKTYDRSGSPITIRKTMASNLRSEMYQHGTQVRLETLIWQYKDYLERLDKKIKMLGDK